MNKMTKYLSVSLMTLALAACGGGGGGGSKSTGGGTTQPTNNAPTVSVNPSSVTLDEGTSATVSISASDADNDSLTITASASSDVVSVSNSDTELVITASQVDADASGTVTVTVSDGKASRTATVSVSVVDTTPPEVELELDTEAVSGSDGNELVVTFTTTEANGHPVTVTAEAVGENAHVISEVSVEGTTVLIQTVNEVSEDTTATVTVTASVAKTGDSVSQDVTVTVLAAEEENNAPTITLSGADEYNIVNIYTDEVVTIPVIISDVDGDDLSWGLAEEFRSSFEEDHANNPLKGVRSYHFDTENDVITIELDFVPMGSIYKYNTFLWVNDGKETVRKDFFIRGENRPNGTPVFSFSDEVVAGRVPVDVGGSTTFSYEIVDDAPEHVEIGDIVVQSGDASLFSFEVNTDAQTITVTHNGATNGDEVSFSIPFTDTQSSGSLFLTAVSREAWGAWQESMMDYVFENRQMIAASKEYEAIVHFYADVLENTGIITEFQAHSYKHAAAVDDSKDLDLFVAVRSLNVIEEYVILGQWSEGDEVATVSTVDFRVGRLAEVHGQTAQSIVEELATLSDGLLPSIPFITSVSEYDSANNYYTRFGSGTYGSVQNGKWEFNSEYRFLQAIVEKTRSDVAPKYQK